MERKWRKKRGSNHINSRIKDRFLGGNNDPPLILGHFFFFFAIFFCCRQSPTQRGSVLKCRPKSIVLN